MRVGAPRPRVCGSDLVVPCHGLNALTRAIQNSAYPGDYGGGTLVTPRAGLAAIPVYGRAYPVDISTATLGYTIPAGQVYVAKDLVGADYYDATTFDALDTYRVFTGSTRFYEISFNHRIAFLKADDVDVVH